MRILILGGDGMLGHQLYKSLRQDHDVSVTLRQSFKNYTELGLFDPERTDAELNVRSLESLTEVFARRRPEVVVNCVGIVKQRDDTDDAILNLEVNALLPHRLALLCRASGARLIHISTDCVFDGKKGLYVESDTSNAADLYGRTKHMGEVSGESCITLRTSIIGRELSRKRSLLEWFLAQTGTVRGYEKAIFSGLTTIELSRTIKTLIEEHPTATGLFHVSADPIDKNTLLRLLKHHFGLPIEIIPDATVAIDRSLDSTKFRERFGYTPPSWPAMIAEL